MPTKTITEKPLFMTVIPVFLGLALIAVSTRLALESNRYLEVLNQNGLNQHHAFGILVCISFLAGVFLITQRVLSQGSASTDEHFDKALTR